MSRIGASKTSDAVIYLPGIMGSELVDADGKVAWGMRPRILARQLVFRDVMQRIKYRPGDGITASQPLRLPVSVPLLTGIEPYTNLEHRLRSTTLRPDAVRAFAYDWRRSVADAAEALAPVARAHLADWRQRFAALPEDERQGRPEPRLTLVGHSMGGLVASWFATRLREQGGDNVRLIITLGTPYRGSLNALRVLATGEYLPFGMFASSLRDAVRTMPGVYELLARYACVVEGTNDLGAPLPYRHLTPADLDAVGADADLTAQAQHTMGTFAEEIARDGAGRIRSLVGTTQPTLQSVRFGPEGPTFLESVVDANGLDEDNRGDGTVFRYAAFPEGVTPTPLPQAHGALAKSAEGVQFAVDTVTGRPLGAFQAASDLGVRVPELAVAGTPFTVEALDAEQGALCQVHDAETNALVTMQALTPRDGTLAADIQAPDVGAYRVSVASTGFSPVERLVLVTKHEQ
jgi:pimeloyl-ACP methyl ester carboxylesterase